MSVNIMAASLRCSVASGGMTRFAVILRQPCVNIEPGIEPERQRYCFLTADYADLTDDKRTEFSQKEQLCDLHANPYIPINPLSPPPKRI